MTTSTTFGQRLRELRQIAGLSGRALDALAGLHPNHVAALEHVDNCQSTTARKLADALGCTVGWLVAGEGTAPEADAVRAAIERARSAPPQPAADDPVEPATDAATAGAA